MSQLVKTFKELTAEQQRLAGGKGGALAKLYQAGYPVPDGFVILPSAFAGDRLTPAAWMQVRSQLQQLRNGNGETPFAVRSSALSEDSAEASFAGEFETVLDVHTDEMIGDAIHTVRRSRKSERVQAYSQAKGMDFAHEVAVVVQKLVRADIAGILFTADPVTGSRVKMSGNFVFGLGEELVSGLTEPYTFELIRPKGRYDGPEELKSFARQIYRLGNRLEKELDGPQDIEWAIAGGKLFLLQSRPITTLREYDPATGYWNSSHAGDYLWIGHEVFPDVMTPSSFSIWQSFHAFELAGARGMGSIGGRVYMNYSLIYSLMRAFGKSEEDTREYVELAAGAIPEEIEVPEIPFSKLGLIKEMLPIQWQLLPRQFKLKRKFDPIVGSVPERCRQIRERLRAAKDKNPLVALWIEELFPLFDDLLLIQDGLNEDYFYPFIALKKQLTKLIGKREADALLSMLVAGSGQLVSIGSLVGLAKLAKGEMSRAEYMELAGHRPQKENELMEPRPYEDPDWLDRQLTMFRENPIDVAAMIEKRVSQFERAWSAFAQTHPRKAKGLRRKIERISTAIEKREKIRLELTRTFGVIREWFLLAGEMVGLGDDIFFLTREEVLQLLAGDESAVATIPTRKETYHKLNELPPYPQIINGRFDPFQWAADPDRRSDIFDSHAPVQIDDTGTIEGFPGSAGRVEGAIRFLAGPDEGDLLQRGEILLASTTNVGWTTVFPKAAAVITDIGAPLSHAAIVARELGIPAVVGCGNATMRLKTGDRVIVDGSRGTVEIVGNA